MKGWDIFILRPVMTVLLSLSIVLLGVLGFSLMPVAPLPQLDFPVIVVEAELAGASPETMSSSVAAPLERTLGKISGVSELTSSSSQGTTSIVIQFDLERDINSAARDVQAGINAASGLLPSAMTSKPQYFKLNPASMPVLMLALTSDRLDGSALYDLASSLMKPKIAQVKGVGEVSLYGGTLPALRVELEPYRLEQQGISLDTVQAALTNAIPNAPTGVLQNSAIQWWLKTDNQSVTASQLKSLVVVYKNGAPVRLEDVAHVYDGPEALHAGGFYNGRSSVLIGVTRAADANIIATVNGVKAALPAVKDLMPADVEIHTVLDRSTTVKASLIATEEALLIAIALVVVVVFLFLRNWRVVAIPACALPLSLIGTCGVIYLLGYSLNILSLMALIIATGFVVDDAIVVLENIIRHREMGKNALQAALVGAREIGFTVLAMTLSLIAVFIPILFATGLIGRLFREFAVTLSVSLVISLLVSLTLTPMMCAYLLHDSAPKASRDTRLTRLWRQSSTRAMEIYTQTLRWALRHRRIVLCSLPLAVAATVYLIIIVPKAFFPDQDTGILMGHLKTDQSTSAQAMLPLVDKLNRQLRDDPDIESVMSSVGGGGFSSHNSAMFIIQLKPLDMRKHSARQVVLRLSEQLNHMPGASLFLRPAQELGSGGRNSNAAYDYTLQSDDVGLLRTWTPKVVNALRAIPQLSGVDSDAEDGGREVQLTIDRAQAARYGLDMASIDSFLGNAFGQRPVATRFDVLNQYHIVMGLAPQYTQDPDILQHMFIINEAGQRIPLSAFTHFETGNAALEVNHQDQMATNAVSFNLAEGVTLADAQHLIDQALVRMALPSEIKTGFAGTAQMFQKQSNTLPWLLLAALVSMYIVLGVLYESVVHPWTILSTLPSAGLGALLLIWLSGTDLSVISFIGILLLLGIVKKNAIMMVDFAEAHRRETGASEVDSILLACQKRLRPIMMTSVAAFCGALPLLLESGGSADLRRPLGVAIAGGLVVSQLLTLYTTPVVYLYMARFQRWLTRLWQRVRPT